jgi:hypothetical protein
MLRELPQPRGLSPPRFLFLAECLLALRLLPAQTLGLLTDRHRVEVVIEHVAGRRWQVVVRVRLITVEIAPVLAVGATVSFTLDTYSHVLPGVQEDAAERVAALIT